jgi:hypothetical protein
VFSLPPKSIKIEGIGRKTPIFNVFSHFSPNILISVHFTAQYQNFKQTKNELSAKMHVQLNNWCNI